MKDLTAVDILFCVGDGSVKGCEMLLFARKIQGCGGDGGDMKIGVKILCSQADLPK